MSTIYTFVLFLLGRGTNRVNFPAPFLSPCVSNPSVHMLHGSYLSILAQVQGHPPASWIKKKGGGGTKNRSGFARKHYIRVNHAIMQTCNQFVGWVGTASFYFSTTWKENSFELWTAVALSQMRRLFSCGLLLKHRSCAQQRWQDENHSRLMITVLHIASLNFVHCFSQEHEPTNPVCCYHSRLIEL